MKQSLDEPRLDAPGATGNKPVQPPPEAVMNVVEYEGSADKQKITPPPPSFTGQFTRVANRYYFKDRPDQEAFVDQGERLRTRHNRSAVAKAMLDLAESRGWDTIKVSGHPDFQQAVWLEASLKGIAVTGYAPTPQEQAALHTRQQEQDSAIIRPSVSSAPATAASPTPVQTELYRQAQSQEKAAPRRQAVDTLDQRNAINTYPELARLYPLLAEAEHFAKAYLRPENQPEFIEQIKKRSLQELARGVPLPMLPTVADPAPGRDRRQERAAEVEP